MSSNTVTFHTEGDVGFITLNRPDQLNALSFELLRELLSLIEDVSVSTLRCVVVSGNGPSFSAGFDVQGFRDSLLSQADPILRYEAAELGGLVATALETLPQITVAALHGNVVGGAIVLATACDLRVADKDTEFSIPEIDLGIPLAWGGIPRLVDAVGSSITKELVLTGRPFTAQEARDLHWLNAMTEPGGALATATELAEHIATKPRFPVVATKRHIAEVINGDRTRDDAMGLITALDDPESTEARDAYLARFLQPE